MTDIVRDFSEESFKKYLSDREFYREIAKRITGKKIKPSELSAVYHIRRYYGVVSSNPVSNRGISNNLKLSGKEIS